MSRLISLICALPEEFKALQDVFQFSNLRTIEGHENIWQGSTQESDFIIGVCNIGCINASIMASTICLVFKPSMMFFCGIAGAICKTLKTGDVVVPNKAFYIESATHTVFEAIWGTPNPLLALPDSSKFSEQLKLPRNDITFATVATSDVFPAPLSSLQSCHHHNATIIDMETYPTAFVAQKFNIPFYAIRSVSNGIETENIPEDAISFSAKNAALVTKQLVAFSLIC